MLRAGRYPGLGPRPETLHPKPYLNLPKPTFLKGLYNFHIRIIIRTCRKVGFGSLR